MSAITPKLSSRNLSYGDGICSIGFDPFSRHWFNEWLPFRLAEASKTGLMRVVLPSLLTARSGRQCPASHSLDSTSLNTPSLNHSENTFPYSNYREAECERGFLESPDQRFGLMGNVRQAMVILPHIVHHPRGFQSRRSELFCIHNSLFFTSAGSSIPKISNFHMVTLCLCCQGTNIHVVISWIFNSSQ